MKFAAFGFVVATLSLSVSAQVANNSTTAATDATATTVIAPTQTSVSACAIQSTFELCLVQEQKYIETCNTKDVIDYACLCRWNKEKLGCFNNCPGDDKRPAQQAEVDRVCSMPGANVSVAPWTSSILPTITPTVQTSIVPTSSNTASTVPVNAHSGASTLFVSQGPLFVAGAIAAYVLL
ncbi:unnamed protein product [Mucor hiemalis]